MTHRWHQNGDEISHKYSGVLVDQHLTFEEHCKFIKGKIARGIGILYKGKKYLNQKSLLNIYYAFIYPYFTYCITVWGNTSSYILDPLVKLQKRAIRLVDGAGKYDHTAPVFQKYELLNLRDLYIYCAQIFLSKHHQKTLPECFLISLKWTTLSMIIIQGKKSTKLTTTWLNTWITIVLMSRLNMF